MKVYWSASKDGTKNDNYRILLLDVVLLTLYPPKAICELLVPIVLTYVIPTVFCIIG